MFSISKFWYKKLKYIRILRNFDIKNIKNTIIFINLTLSFKNNNFISINKYRKSIFKVCIYFYYCIFIYSINEDNIITNIKSWISNFGYYVHNTFNKLKIPKNI